MPSVQARAGLAFVHLCRAGQGGGWVGDVPVPVPATRPPVLPPAPTCLAVSSRVPRLAHACRRPVCLLARPAVLAHLGLARQLLCGGKSKGKRGGEATRRTSTPCSLLLPAGRARQSAEPAPQTGQGQLGQPGPSLQFCFLGAGSLPRKENSPLSFPSSTGTHGEPDTGSVPSAGRASPAGRGCPAAPLPLLAWKPGSSTEPLGHQPLLPSPRPEERCCEQMPPPPADVAACISSDSSGGELGREAGNAPSGFQRLRTWPPPAKAPHGAGSPPPPSETPAQALNASVFQQGRGSGRVPRSRAGTGAPGSGLPAEEALAARAKFPLLSASRDPRLQRSAPSTAPAGNLLSPGHPVSLPTNPGTSEPLCPPWGSVTRADPFPAPLEV